MQVLIGPLSGQSVREDLADGLQSLDEFIGPGPVLTKRAETECPEDDPPAFSGIARCDFSPTLMTCASSFTASAGASSGKRSSAWALLDGPAPHTREDPVQGSSGAAVDTRQRRRSARQRYAYCPRRIDQSRALDAQEVDEPFQSLLDLGVDQVGWHVDECGGQVCEQPLEAEPLVWLLGNSGSRGGPFARLAGG